MPLLSHLRRWFLSEGIHDCSKFLGADGSISILVKQGECFSEFCCLFLCQMVCHYFLGPCLKECLTQNSALTTKICDQNLNYRSNVNIFSHIMKVVR